jgi:hypothetical protein
MADSSIVPLKAPTENAPKELLTQGARDLLAAAIEAEVVGLIESCSGLVIAGKLDRCTRR